MSNKWFGKTNLHGPESNLVSTDQGNTSRVDLMNLKSQLRLYLETKSMTAAQLSRKSGVSKANLSLWLNGGSPRNLDQVKKVADIFETSIDQLCFGKGVERSSREKQNIDSIPEDEWLGGIFEVKFRRVKERKS